MSISRLIIGDRNVARFWSEAQLARPQLLGSAFKAASCVDTLNTALLEVTDVLDVVLISMLTEFIIDEASASDVSHSCGNIIGDVLRAIGAASRKSKNVQVVKFLLCF